MCPGTFSQSSCVYVHEFMYVQEENKSHLLFVSFDCDSLSEE